MGDFPLAALSTWLTAGGSGLLTLANTNECIGLVNSMTGGISAGLKGMFNTDRLNMNMMLEGMSMSGDGFGIHTAKGIAT